MQNKKLSQFLLVLITLVVAIVLLSLLNIVTAPIIEQNQMGAELEPLYRVMDGAKGFEKLELNNLPSTVKSVWKETSGMGYVVRSATNKGFTGKDIELTSAISTDGKVISISLDAYPETKDFGSDYPLTFVGQDSTLSGTTIVAGVTYSSSAFRGAVADAFKALTDNKLVTEAKKEPKQIVEEMLPVVFGEALNPKSLVQATEFDSSIGGVQKAYLANNKAAVAYWVEENGENYVAISNVDGITVYDMDSKVTSSLSSTTTSSLYDEAKSKIKDDAKKDLKRLVKAFSSATSTRLSLSGIDTNVTSAYLIEDSGKKYYGFGIRPYGFGNETMVMYLVLTEDGKIYSFSVKELIIEADYFSQYTLRDDYYDTFVGLDSSWSGDEAIISGATLSSDAVRDALNDGFAVYASLKGGNN